ncbi:MAG TPA: TonB-dependent receptor plug domain-containing protein, partial [Gemmatimonadaceae bacterium]
MRHLIAFALTALSLFAGRSSAQQPTDSGTVEISIEESMGMLDGFRIQWRDRIATTDSSGRARLTLPVGRQTLTIMRIGFVRAQVTADVIRDSLVFVRVPVSMSEEAMELGKMTVSATRTERLAGETPIRVEMIDEMEVDENTLMSPSGIGMLLNETPGLRVQATAPGLGTGSVRILGLPGQYTVMLADGLPLYGASSSALGPLDISPVDLSRVEIIKGAASSLYGGQALGGVINLVAKPPTGKKEILLNRRTMDVTDAATWLSHRFGAGSGISLLASGTIQGVEDIDDDGWADQPRARRWSIRPRYNAVSKSGKSLFATAGYGYDDRHGGTVARRSGFNRVP